MALRRQYKNFNEILRVAVLILFICGLVCLQTDMMHSKFNHVVRFYPLLSVTHLMCAHPQKIFRGNLHIMIYNQYFSQIYNTRPLNMTVTFYHTKYNLKGISSIITIISKLPKQVTFRTFLCVRGISSVQLPIFIK